MGKPWILAAKHKDGSRAYWICDKRPDGQSVAIPAGATRAEAELVLEQYIIRCDLANPIIDEVIWPKRRQS